MDNHQVIASNGDLRLHALSATHGYVVNQRTGQRFPDRPIASVLAYGLWEMADEPLKFYEWFTRKGGEGSGESEGHAFRGNQWTHGIGSGHSNENSKIFAQMDVRESARSKGNKRWAKSVAERYKNDQKFKGAVDYCTLYTQGSYKELKVISEFTLTGEMSPEWKDSTIPDWVNEDLSVVSNPLAEYKNYIEGQDVAGDHLGITTGEAALEVERMIAESDPLPYPVYRGVIGHTRIVEEGDWKTDKQPVYDKWPPFPKVGDEISLMGASSFSADEQIALDFSRGEAQGQGQGKGRGKGLGAGAWAVFTYEIKAGGAGLPVSALSPWGQDEVLVSGAYRVVEVTELPEPAWYHGRHHSSKIPQYRVVLEQTGVWNVK